jgi:hypothetical protein
LNHLFILASPLGHPATVDFWDQLKEGNARNLELAVYFLHEGAQSIPDSRFTDGKTRLFACPRAVETVAESARERVTLGGPGLLAELIDRASAIHTFSPA